MRWWGKGLGATFGWAAGGPLGAALGLLLGNSADAAVPDPRRWRDLRVAASPSGWYPSLFAVLGHVARADGSVSRADVRFARGLMARLQLGARQRNLAVRAFNRGRDPGFRPEPALARLRAAVMGDRGLAEGFMAVLVAAATIEERPPETVLLLLRRCSLMLGVAPRRLEELLSRAGVRPSTREVDSAYRVLGVPVAASDSEIKLAYRRLMHRHHPDRLGANAPSAVLAQAARRTAEIRGAWEAIKSKRGIR